jgi:hypothetical protein
VPFAPRGAYRAGNRELVRPAPNVPNEDKRIAIEPLGIYGLVYIRNPMMGRCDCGARAEVLALNPAQAVMADGEPRQQVAYARTRLSGRRSTLLIGLRQDHPD